MDIRLYLSRRAWDLERFGLTPRKLLRRAHLSAAPRVVSISLPQSGTHLTERTLCLHPAYYRKLARVNYRDFAKLERLLAAQRPGEVICAHIPHTELTDSLVHDQADAKPIFCIRDPRDMLVSTAHYIYRQPKHPLYPALRRYPRLEDRLALLIEGDPAHGIPPFANPLGRYAGWLDADCYVSRYEELIDPDTRTDSIQRLFAYLGTLIDGPEAERIAHRVVSPVSLTFRRGRIGEWREVFDDSLATRFASVAGKNMARYGYA